VDEEVLLRVAIDRAWMIYLTMHTDVDAADECRCALERYVERRWQAGERDPEELTCSGLFYLSRFPRDQVMAVVLYFVEPVQS
jgi:hypothetical protein